MLSKRDKLLTQPWEERRFKDHRTKVKSALPVIDARAPASRPHVTLKLKKCQRELDRMNKIRNDNFSLLQRLNNIMRISRLDNRWIKPLPNFQHKVGLFYDTKSLNDKIVSRPSVEASTKDDHTRFKCYACDFRKKRYEFQQLPTRTRESLPSINSY